MKEAKAYDPEADETLAVWVTPGAIRSHFDDEDSPEAAWVQQASDDELVEIGRAFMGGDAVWRLFHEELVECAREAMP